MKRCYECGSPQLEGALFCTECGLSLLAPQDGSGTTILPFTHLRHHTTPRLPTDEHGQVTLENELLVTIIIPSSRKRVILPLHTQIQVGRADDEEGFYPELDLTDYQGGEKGVSRYHAIIKAAEDGVVLIDLESTNGTHLNGFRLAGNRPYLIKDGDEVRFGDLLIHIFLG